MLFLHMQLKFEIIWTKISQNCRLYQFFWNTLYILDYTKAFEIPYIYILISRHSYFNIRQVKAWTAIDELSIKLKSDRW